MVSFNQHGEQLRRGKWWSGIGVVLAMCWASVALAQRENLQDLLGVKSDVEHIEKPKFVTTLSPATGKSLESLKPGDEVTLTVAVTLPDGFYIYGTDGTFSGRTQLNVSETGLEPIDPDWVPDRKPKIVFDSLLQEEVSEFLGHVTWKKKYRIAPSGAAMVSAIGEISGQYCSSGSSGKKYCVPIIPGHKFRVALTGDSGRANAEAVSEIRFDYEERPKKGKLNPALLHFRLAPQDASPGETVTLSIAMQLDEGWHTFSLTHMGEGGVATAIAVDQLAGLKPLGDGFVADHAPEIEKLDDSLVLEVHGDRVTWSRAFEVLPETKLGQYGATGTITYQTCKTSCVPAREVAFSLGDLDGAVPVLDGAEAITAETPGDDSASTVSVRSDSTARGAAKPQDRGLLAFVLTAIGFGLVSLLTPCVFPMVPITVSFFLKQSESQHSRPVVVALVFCGAIVATFTVLGVGIAAIFGAAQLNALANNPWLNVAIGAVFVAFGFNMLGLFEIRIPSSLLNFTSHKEAAGGLVGAVFMAITFTLTSFTCTFAFAGTLLVAAAQGQYYWPVIGMMAFGTAFALPFFFLAMVPSLLKKLPKSGGWMNAVKVVMGLIEIGAAVKFFSVADLAWNSVPVLFDFVFVMLAWLVLALGISLYLLGLFRLTHDTPPNGISVARLTLALAFLGLSGNLGVGVLNHERGGGWIMDQIIAFAPPRFEESSAHVGTVLANHNGLPEPTITHHGLRFAMDVDRAIAFASLKQQPMLFDFTGVNCVNCRLMEKKLAQPHNRSRLEKFVLVQLYADKVPMIADPVEAKRLLKRNVDLQSEWFGDVTLPSYAVVTPDGKTILSNYFGLEQKDGEFAKFLDDGLAKWQEISGAGH